MGGITSFFKDPDFVSLLCGVAAAVVVVLIWAAFLGHEVVGEDRLKAVTQRREEFEHEKNKKNSRRALLQNTSLIKRIVEQLKMSQGAGLAGLRLKLRRAGYQSKDTVFIFLFMKLVMLGGAGALAFFLIFVLEIVDWPPIQRFGAMGGAVILGWMLPEIFVSNNIKKRENVLRKAMPDALDLMVICAEAGLGLDSTFDRVSREMAFGAPELAEEIGLTGVEMNFLPERQMALRGLAERVALPSVLALVNTLIQTEKYGTPLAQTLRVLSAEMREDRMMRAEEKAARLPAVMTVPMMLFVLPPLFIVLVGPAALQVADLMK